MPFIAPFIAAGIGAAARTAAGPLLARGASAVAGRAVSASQLAKAAKVVRGAARTGATASRLASFAGNVAGVAGQSVEMEAKPHPVFKAPTMGGEFVNG
jgi:hypothetical protein